MLKDLNKQQQKNVYLIADPIYINLIFYVVQCVL